MKTLDEKYVEVLVKLKWCCSDIGENGIIELENWSPAGENIALDIECNNFVENIRSCADDFDIDEHVIMMAQHRGTNGVPGTVRELLEDSERIKDMLNKLADELEKS